MSALLWTLHGGIPEHMFVHCCCVAVFLLLFDVVFVGLVVFEKKAFKKRTTRSMKNNPT